MLNLTIDSSTKAFYLRLAQAVINSIQTGQLTPGEKLPSSRTLARQLQVNRHTIMRSYAELVAQGWISNKQRSGYKVSEQLPIHRSEHSPSRLLNTDFCWQIRQSISDSNFTRSMSAFEYNFAGGRPDTHLFPFDEYRSHLNDALKRPAHHSLHYGEAQGYPALISQCQRYFHYSRNLSQKELIITNGSQEALYLIAQLLLKTGDNIAVESLGYPPAWQAFKSAGANLIEVAQDDQGLCPQSLKKLAKSTELKCIYLTPLHQYPMTVTLSAKRRAQVYRLAQKHQFFIIEDDYDHEFHFNSQPLSPMAAADPNNLVIYLSSFSKIMFPAARTGVLAVPKALLAPLVNLRASINHKPAHLLQDALARWMASDGFERHIRRCAKAYQQRRDNALQQLDKAHARGAQMSCVAPDGGMALWIKTTVNVQHLAQSLAPLSVFVQHQGEFQLTVTEKQPQHIRVGYAGQSMAQFNKGFNLLVNQVLLQQTSEH